MKLRLSKVSRGRCVIFALVSLMVMLGLVQLAHTQTITDVRIGKPGDRWLDLMEYSRLERATEGGEFGYAVTYVVPNHGSLKLFWPRKSIDLAGKDPLVKRLVRPLRQGRLWYPERITARSLPEVYQGILLLEAAYTRDARGGIQAMEAFVLVLTMGELTPALRTLPVPKTTPKIPKTRARRRTRTVPELPPASTLAVPATTRTMAHSSPAVAGGRAHMTRVGRWMSPDELAAMKRTGFVQEGSGGLHRVVVPASKDAYKAAPKGDVFVTYEVPTSSLKSAGNDAWRAIPGPNSIHGRLAAKKGKPMPQLPRFENLKVEATKR